MLKREKVNILLSLIAAVIVVAVFSASPALAKEKESDLTPIEKAKIEKTNQYNWSSYKEYIYKEELINKQVLLHYFSNDLDQFIIYTNKKENIEEVMNYADFELIPKLSDEELINIIMKKISLKTPKEIISYFKNKNNRIQLKELKDIYKVNKTQLARITRVNSKLIDKIWNE